MLSLDDLYRYSSPFEWKYASTIWMPSIQTLGIDLSLYSDHKDLGFLLGGGVSARRSGELISAESLDVVSSFVLHRFFGSFWKRRADSANLVVVFVLDGGVDARRLIEVIDSSGDLDVDEFCCRPRCGADMLIGSLILPTQSTWNATGTNAGQFRITNRTTEEYSQGYAITRCFSLIDFVREWCFLLIGRERKDYEKDWVAVSWPKKTNANKLVSKASN
jgi:hypothetical protein